MRPAAALFIIVLAPSVASAQTAPTVRLPEGPRPVRQSIELRIDPAREPFEGSTDIDIELPTKTSLLWLNASGLEVSAASFAFGGKEQPAQAKAEGADFLAVHFPSPVGPGRARLHFAFRGVVSRRNAYGIFAKDAHGEPYVFTQFEAIGARRVFPCFDEPLYKIPFEVTLVVPKNLEALSNTPSASVSDLPSGEKRVVFQETKPLPSYLVAFAVGPFEYVDGGRAGQGQTPFRVVVPKGRAGDARFAKEITPKVLALLEKYVGRPYPYEKLDELAVPGIDFAMEHPGLVTYPEDMIVQPAGHESTSVNRNFLETAAHELAHQWFGDLVTTAWWDDLWLNESFANWLGTKITHEVEPRWDTTLDEVVARSQVLSDDSLKSARTIRQPIASDDDIENAFDDITYQKGEAVLEMFEAWLGPDVFQKGARAYLTEHAFGSGRSEDFVRALSTAAEKDLSGPFASFLNQTGAPLITVRLRCEGTPRLSVEQRPYRPLGSNADASRLWQVPVCLTSATPGQSGCILLEKASEEVALEGACPAWIYPNRGGLGYYRVRMGKDEALRALGVGGLGLPERVALVGDLGSLVDGGELPAGDALQLAAKALEDPEPQVVLSAARLLYRMDRSVPASLRGDYAALVERLLGPRAHSLGWHSAQGEDQGTTIQRRALVSIACESGGDTALGKEALALLTQWLDDPSAVEPEVLSRVVEVGALFGDAALLEKVKNRAVVEKDRTRRALLLEILGDLGDPALEATALPVALDPRIDAEGAANLIAASIGHRETASVVFAFLKDHFDPLLAKLPLEFGAALPRVGVPFCSPAERDELSAFFSPRVSRSPGAPRTLQQVLESIDLCIATTRAQTPSLQSFLKAPAP